MSFGYFLDEKSYPGQKVLYLANFPNPAKSNGVIFTVFVTPQNDGSVFNIQNNASFVSSRDGIHGVSFTTPPLGGTWTQEHLALAINQIEKQPRVVIPIADLLATDPATRCESYTDR